jgi:hypothetical protein
LRSIENASWTRDRQAHRDILFGEHIGLAEVTHEFADERAVTDQRDKCGGANTFAKDGGLEIFIEVGAFHIGNINRRGICFVRLPG